MFAVQSTHDSGTKRHDVVDLEAHGSGLRIKRLYSVSIGPRRHCSTFYGSAKSLVRAAFVRIASAPASFCFEIFFSVRQPPRAGTRSSVLRIEACPLISRRPITFLVAPIVLLCSLILGESILGLPLSQPFFYAINAVAAGYSAFAVVAMNTRTAGVIALEPDGKSFLPGYHCMPAHEDII